MYLLVKTQIRDIYLSTHSTAESRCPFATLLSSFPAYSTPIITRSLFYYSRCLFQSIRLQQTVLHLTPSLHRSMQKAFYLLHLSQKMLKKSTTFAAQYFAPCLTCVAVSGKWRKGSLKYWKQRRRWWHERVRMTYSHGLHLRGFPILISSKYIIVLSIFF